MMLSRELRRVPLDFDFPIGQTWPGFLAPPATPCPAGADCLNGGTAAREWLEKVLINLMILPENVGRPVGQMHPYLLGVPQRPDVPPSADIGELTGGLAGRAPRMPFGHDSSDKWRAASKIIEAAGLDPDVWGVCPVCKGLGHHPDDEEAFENFKPTEPPDGPGYQLWQTISEGGPCSPVFETKDELAGWLSANDTSILAGKSPAEWMEILNGAVFGTDVHTGELVPEKTTTKGGPS